MVKMNGIVSVICFSPVLISFFVLLGMLICYAMNDGEWVF